MSARIRSGKVHEAQRHTVALKIRCPEELAERARRLAAGDLTLADVLAAGCEALERRSP